MKTRKKVHTLLQSSSLPTSQAGTVILFLILSILTGTCEAQNGNFVGDAITITVTLIVVAVVMCVVFCGCVCCVVYVCNQRQHSARTIQYTHNRQSQSHQGAYPQSQYPSGSQSYPQQTYHYPQSGHPAYPPQPTATVEPQPVSLPEATLHQGDAPPAYEEAIRMRTVDFESDQNK